VEVVRLLVLMVQTQEQVAVEQVDLELQHLRHFLVELRIL
jgi:hypothetical protein